ncbi:stage II sporulation protein M [Paenibacillus sp. CC-CFT747]|nr:stage II sporulation protein M [Paenibacillus sp. CC-CFT747]
MVRSTAIDEALYYCFRHRFPRGGAIGYFYPEMFRALMDSKINQLQDVAKQLVESEHKQLYTFLFIFTNNTVLSILMMYAGMLFGLIPLYFLVTNGMILGYLASYNETGDKWYLFAKGIAPHGIIEIPAIVLACAFGLRFGFLLLEAIASLPSAARRRESGTKPTHS